MRQLYHQELMRFYMNQIAVLYTMTVKFGSTKCWKESHLKKKNHFTRGKRWLGDREYGFKRNTARWGFCDWRSWAGQKGDSVHRENRSKKSASCLQSTLFWPKVFEWHVTWNTEATSNLSEVKDASYFSLGSLRTSLSRHDESIADTTLYRVTLIL